MALTAAQVICAFLRQIGDPSIPERGLDGFVIAGTEAVQQRFQDIRSTEPPVQNIAVDACPFNQRELLKDKPDIRALCALQRLVRA